MSTVRFNTWQDTGGTEVANSTLGTGKILQVVSTTKTDSFATTSTSLVDVTGVTLSITPTSTSSKVFVICTGLTGNNNASNANFLDLVRDSTSIGIGTGGNDNNTSLIFTANASNGATFALTYLDSPATTSATTYKLQMKVNGGSGVIGRIAANDLNRVSTTITALEVSA